MRTVLCSDRPGGRGVVSAGGVCPSASPLRTEFLTHACENITFPQLRFADGNNANFILAVPLEMNLTNEILNVEM